MTDAPSGTKSSREGAAVETASDGKKRFEVKKVSGTVRAILIMCSNGPIQWNAVALWAWDIVVDNCAICRNHIMDLCELEKLTWVHVEG